MADRSQQTEKPTPQRLNKARKEGQFTNSREIVSAIQFLVFVGLIVNFAPDWLTNAQQLTRYLVTRGFQVQITPGEVQQLAGSVFQKMLFPLVLGGAALMAVTISVQLVVTQFGVATKKLAPDPKRLNPLNKLRELPRQNIPQFFQAVVLLPLFCTAVWAVAADNVNSFLMMPFRSVQSGIREAALSVESLLWRSGGLFLVWGAVDLLRQRRRHLRDLMMSRQEIKDEHKESEGDPQAKMRIRRLQRELLRRQMMKAVPTATAVVVNPTHYAVAIRYQVEQMGAPVVVAKGKNYLALRIRQRAIENQVPIVENPPLAQALYKAVAVGQEIPASLYRAVAEILAYIYKLMNRRL